MKWWRCLWLHDELTSVEKVELPAHLLALAKEEGKTDAEVAASCQRCINDARLGIDVTGHACFVVAETIEAAAACARKLHPRSPSEIRIQIAVPDVEAIERTGARFIPNVRYTPKGASVRFIRLSQTVDPRIVAAIKDRDSRTDRYGDDLV